MAGGIGVRFSDKRAAIVLFLAILVRRSIRSVSSGIVIDHLARNRKLYRPAGSECLKHPVTGKGRPFGVENQLPRATTNMVPGPNL